MIYVIIPKKASTYVLRKRDAIADPPFEMNIFEMKRYN